MHKIIFSLKNKILLNLFLIVAALTLYTAPPAVAAEFDGNSLLERCRVVVNMKSGGTFDPSLTNNLMYCIGYFSGVIGSYNNTVVLDNYKVTPYCLPMGITWKPVAEQVGFFMLKHPELLHQPAEALITFSLKG